MENTIRTLQSLGASAPMAAFMASVQQSKDCYKVEWAHYEWVGSTMHNIEHNETPIMHSLDKAMGAYKGIKRNSHYKGYSRWIHISVSHDNGKTFTGSYFHDQF